MAEQPLQYARLKERVGKVPVSTKIYQGVGAWPNTFKDFAFNTFLLFYYNQVLGIPATLASIAMAIALVIDAISDPLVGSYSDNLRSRLGRRHPLMYAAALPLGFFLWATFSPPGGLSEIQLFVWLTTFAIATRLSLTFFLVPWNAVFAEFTDDYNERTEIITYRYALGWAGGLTFTFLAWTFIFPKTEEYPDFGQLNPDAYHLFAPVLGVAVALAVLFTTHMTRREIPYLYHPTEALPPFRFANVFGELVLALKNRDFMFLFLMILIGAIIAGTGGAFDLYMGTYFWGLAGEDMRWYAVAIIGVAVAFMFLNKLQRRFDKKDILVWGLMISLIDGIAFVNLRFLDVLPDNGDPLLLQLIVVNRIFRAAVLTTVGVIFASMIADLLDAQELNTGRRQEGVFSAALSFSGKVTGGVGVVIGGLVLDHVINFPRDAKPGSLDQDTITLLGIVDGIVVPLFYLLPFYLASRYKLTRERHAQIRLELDAKKLALARKRDIDAAAASVVEP